MNNDTKLCPYCKEEVQTGAVVCKHCKSKLKGKKKKIHFFVFLLLLIILLPSVAFGSYTGYFYYDNNKKIEKASGFKTNGNYVEALGILEQALKQHPISNQRERILKQKDEVIVLQNDENSYNIGLKYYNEGSYSDAKRVFDLVGKESPKYADAQAKSADCSTKLILATTPSAAATPKTITTVPAQNNNQSKKDFAQSKVDGYVKLMEMVKGYINDDYTKLAECHAEGIVSDCGAIYNPDIAKYQEDFKEYVRQADDWQKQVLQYSQ